MRVKDLYEPKIIEDFQLAGFSTKTVGAGEMAKIVQKIFITSLDKDFRLIATNLLSLIVPIDPGESLNSLLVIIKPDNKAYVYYKFPFGYQMIAKRDIEAHRAVFRKDVVDITSVFFKDMVIDLNPKDGDRLIWLFRQNWTFGLFFDLSGKLKSKSVLAGLRHFFGLKRG